MIFVLFQFHSIHIPFIIVFTSEKDVLINMFVIAKNITTCLGDRIDRTEKKNKNDFCKKEKFNYSYTFLYDTIHINYII